MRQIILFILTDKSILIILTLNRKRFLYGTNAKQKTEKKKQKIDEIANTITVNIKCAKRNMHEKGAKNTK